MDKAVRYSQWSFSASITFLALLTLLHFIRSDIAPSWNFISEYEVGKFGWMMQLAFLALALSCIFLVIALWKNVKIVGKIGLIMLLISALGMIIAAIFKTDPLNTAPELVTQSGKLHQLGAMLDQIPFAAIFITIALFLKKEWNINRILLILSLLFVWVGFIYFVGSVKANFPADGKFGPNVLVGWQNRLMIISQVLWLAFIARNSETRIKKQ